MIAVSDDFKTAMKQPIKELDAYIKLDEDNKITSADDLISFKVSCDTGMCKTAMRKLEAKYLGEHNLLGQWVHVGFGVKLPNGTFEYLDYGSFLITEITTTKDTDTTQIVGYDKMISSMKEYHNSIIEYPINLYEYTKNLCLACGLELGNEIFGEVLFNGEMELGGINNDTGENTNNTKTIRSNNFIKVNPNTTYTITNNLDCSIFYHYYDKDKKYLGYSNVQGVPLTFTTTLNTEYIKIRTGETENITDLTIKIQIECEKYNKMNDWNITQELWENIDGITYRDILVQIAQATASTCIISNNDKVYFKPINNTGETLTYDNMKKLKLEPIYGEINSVVLSRTPQEDNIYLGDDDSIKTNGLTEYKIENNEIVDKDRDNAITPIYNALHGISYYPFETTTEGLGWYEIGDSFDIINDTGDIFNTTLFNFSITIDGGINEILKTVADTKTQTQYQYARTIDKRVKNTEIIVNKQEQYIEQLVTDMYEENGVLHENFTNVYQDIDNIVASIQNTGGNNLIKNSVMFANEKSEEPTYDVENLDDCTYGFNLLSDGYYESTNFGQNYTFSMCKLNLHIPKDNTILKLSCINYAENYYDYGILGKLDTELNKTYTADSSDIVEKSFKGLNSENEVEVIYSNIPKGDHCIYIKYIKDSSNSYFNDSFKFKVTQLGSNESDFNINSWNIEGEGTIEIKSDAEALNSGSLSGNTFTLLNKKVSQKISVKMDTDLIPEEEKTYYTFSTKIKKDIIGTCYVKLYNSNEEHIIELKEGESSFYGDYEIKELLPKNNYYIIEFYGSENSNATFTDNMLAIGKYKTQWTQASGEIMNTQVNINLDGVLVKSSVYIGDYTVMSPLEFAGYSNINGTITKVFSLNKDTTLVKKLEAQDEINMKPIKVIPITTGDVQGWAFVPST